jgi:hypothetical protein
MSLLQKPNQMRQGSAITTSTAVCSSMMPQKWLCMVNRHIAQSDTVLPEPSTKKCADPRLISN